MSFSWALPNESQMTFSESHAIDARRQEGNGRALVDLLLHARRRTSHLTRHSYSIFSVCSAASTLCEFLFNSHAEPYYSLLGIVPKVGHPHGHFIAIDTVGSMPQMSLGTLRTIYSAWVSTEEVAETEHLSWSFWLHGPCLFLSIKQICFKYLKTRQVETRNERACAHHEAAVEEEEKGG